MTLRSMFESTLAEAGAQELVLRVNSASTAARAAHWLCSTCRAGGYACTLCRVRICVAMMSCVRRSEAYPSITDMAVTMRLCFQRRDAMRARQE